MSTDRAALRPRTPIRLQVYQAILGAGWLVVCNQTWLVEPGPAGLRGGLGLALLLCSLLLLVREYWVLATTAVLNGLGLIVLVAPIFWGNPEVGKPIGRDFEPPVQAVRWWLGVDLRFWMSIYSLVVIALTLSDLMWLYRRYRSVDAASAEADREPPLR